MPGHLRVGPQLRRLSAARSTRVAAIGAGVLTLISVGLVAARGGHGAANSTETGVTRTVPVPMGTGSPLGTMGTPAGVRLEAMSGETVRTAGTVLDAKDISGQITIAAANVTISRSRIHGTDSFGILVQSGSVTVTDTTLTGFDYGIAGDNYTATRVEVTALQGDGFVLGSNTTIDSSWCHDLTPGTGAHADCAQLQSGENNVTVRNSWLDPGKGGAVQPNSALFLAPDLGPSSNGPLTIANNVLGGGNFTMQCVDGNNGEYFIKTINITGNRFLRDSQYGPARINVPVNASDNVWADTGKPIPIN